MARPARILLQVSLALIGVSEASPLWANVCSPEDETSKFDFCNQQLSLEERAAAYVKQLTLEEKQSLLGNTVEALPRIGLPAYQWWSEGLHGANEPCVSDNGVTKCPTSFPAASAMASALNDTLYLGVGKVVGVEGRSISNLRNHDNSIGDGLTYWAPNANMERDPRWGRNMEAPGEDPHLTSKYVANFVRGLQEGEDPEHVLMVATCKHFIANSLEHSTINGKTITRHDFDAEVPLPELVDYYMPSFKACVQEGRALGIMCSYNAVNGVPMCANRELLTDVLRDQWGFDGYVTSDCTATLNIYDSHHFVPDIKTATALGLEAGCDSDCGAAYQSTVVQAVNASILSEETVDNSLKRLVKIQMKVGLFEPKNQQIYFDSSRYGINQIDTQENKQLAYEAALQSIVLLKNDKNTLPLKRGIKLALIGPHVDGQEVFMSNYYGKRCPSGKFDCITPPIEAIKKANVGGTTTGHRGVDVNSTVNNITEAVQAAQDADTIVLLVGISSKQEREELDRWNCTFPGLQTELISAVAALKKPTVMVLIHGGAMCLGALKDSVPSIVDAFYGGEKGPEALADVLFGDYNPSGKLPITMYPPEYMYQIPLTQMSVSAPPGRTHLYYTGTPEFAFGTGLSYSTWSLRLVEGPNSKLLEAGPTHVQVELTNRGPLAGQQRVLAFARPKGALVSMRGMKKQWLWSYAAAELSVGQSTTLSFQLEPLMLSHSNERGDRVLHAGEYELAFSDGSQEMTTSLTVSGRDRVVEASAFREAVSQRELVV